MKFCDECFGVCKKAKFSCLKCKKKLCRLHCMTHNHKSSAGARIFEFPLPKEANSWISAEQH